jgi:hypothetical protein
LLSKVNLAANYCEALEKLTPERNQRYTVVETFLISLTSSVNVKLNAFNIYGLYFLDCVLGIGYFILGLHYLKVYKILKKGEETKDNSILEMKNLSLTTKF